MLSFWLSKIVPQAHAACNPSSGTLDLGDCYTLGVGGDPVKNIYNNPTVLLNTIISTLYIASGVIFFFLIIYSGLKFISGGTKGKDEAKTIMTTAIAGLVIMFVAYWIIQIVEIVTGSELLF